jgi:hypothetical protein
LERVVQGQPQMVLEPQVAEVFTEWFLLLAEAGLALLVVPLPQAEWHTQAHLLDLSIALPTQQPLVD